MTTRTSRCLAGSALVVLAATALAACSSTGSDSPTVNAPSASPSSPTATSPAATSPPSAASAAPSVAASGAAAASPVPSATAAAATQTVPLTVPSGLGGGAFATSRTLQVPPGSTVEVWARVAGARFEQWTPQGDLLVSVPSAGTIVRLHPGSDPAAPPTQSTLVSGLTSPQGMAFDTVNGATVLYVAESDAIVRYVWNGTAVGAMTTLVSGLPGTSSTYAHPLKEVVVAADHSVYYDVASATNADPADRQAGEARIYRLAAGAAMPTPATRPTVVMTGVRNGDGLSFDPTGQLWSAVNMRDNIANPAGDVVQSYVNDHPPDEIVKVTQGRDLGWPYCDPDQTLSNQSDPYGNVPLRNDPQTDSAGTLDCAKLPAVERGIPAHSAPLGFHFLQGSKLPAAYQAGAVLGTHGSNDHVPPKAAELYWLPWNAGTKTLGAVQPLLAGFIDSAGDRWGKPVDAAAGPDGSLYVSDDVAGAIYRLTLPGSTAASQV